VELVGGHQVLDVAEAHLPESVTLGDSQHDGIVRQSHFGVDAAVQGVAKDERRATEVTFAELFRDQVKTQTAAIGLLQVAHDNPFGELVEIDRPVAARAKADHLAAAHRARQGHDLGADLRGDGAENRKPGL